MKRLLLFSVLLFACSFIQAQEEDQQSEVTDKFYFIGARLRLMSPHAYSNSIFNKMELALGKLTPKGFCFQVKLGTDNYGSQQSGTVYVGGGPTEQATNSYYRANGFFVKPGWIFYKRNNGLYANYLSFNLSASYAHHGLSIVTVDPVYGEHQRYYEKKTFHPLSSIELEHCNMFNITKGVDLNLSYYLGVKTAYPDVFGDVIDGYGSQSGFVPGTYSGGALYFNLLVGINIHLY